MAICSMYVIYHGLPFVGVASYGIANLGIKVAAVGIKGSSTSKFVVHKKNFCDDSMIQNMKYLN